jgi:hypothetical protein
VVRAPVLARRTGAQGLELVVGGSGPEALAELGMQMRKNHLRNLLFVDPQGLVLIIRAPFGARHLPLLVVFETDGQLQFTA